MLDVIISRLASAIATAEGFFVSGSRPARNHNPGDLERDITNTGVGWDGPFVVYASDNDGWDALKQQVRLMLTDASSIYNSGMSILDVASHYTATDAATWAQNVADALGVTVDTTLEEILGEDGPVAGAAGGAVLLLLLAAILARKMGYL